MFRRRRGRRRGRGPRGGHMTWLRPVALAAFLALTATSGSSLPTAVVPSAWGQPTKVQQPPGTPPGPMPELPLDEPVRMLLAAQAAYNSVQSYECILISQERVNGKLLPENVMQMTFRKNPFSVYLKWLGPKENLGREVCYVQGKNANQLKAKSPLGWTSIAIDSPLVMQNSRHKITEAGFGNLIERCGRGWEIERAMGKTQVQMAEYEYNKRRCIRIEAVHIAQDRSFYCYRTVLYIDTETRLPVRMECYDWPRPGGSPQGELLECFSYVNLRFNTNPPDSVFNH